MKILKNPIFKNYTSLSLNHGAYFIKYFISPLFLKFWVYQHMQIGFLFPRLLQYLH